MVSSIVALRVALEVEPASDPAEANVQLMGLAHALRAAGVVNDAALRATAFETGVVERLVLGSKWRLAASPLVSYDVIVLVKGLIDLCGPRNAAPDACRALRVITAGGVEVADAAARLWDLNDAARCKAALAGARLLARLQCVALAVPTPNDEAVVSAFREEAKLFQALFSGLLAPALVEEEWATGLIDALSSFAKSASGGRCSQNCAAAATEGVVHTLQRLPPECLGSVELAWSCANALRAFAGGCGGADAAAPGTHALQLGVWSCWSRCCRR